MKISTRLLLPVVAIVLSVPVMADNASFDGKTFKFINHTQKGNEIEPKVYSTIPYWGTDDNHPVAGILWSGSTERNLYTKPYIDGNGYMVEPYTWRGDVYGVKNKAYYAKIWDFRVEGVQYKVENMPGNPDGRSYVDSSCEFHYEKGSNGAMQIRMALDYSDPNVNDAKPK